MAYTLILHSTNKARDHCAFQETDDPLLECIQATGRFGSSSNPAITRPSTYNGFALFHQSSRILEM